MLAYVQILDKETKRCSVGTGSDIDFYKSIGMEEKEVEQAYNGNWYLKGYAPIQPIEDQIKQIYNEYNSNIETMLDDFAHTRNYKNIETVCSYYNSTNEKFKQEAIYCSNIRDEIYTKCYELLDKYIPKITTGEIDIPTWEEIKLQLPKLKWPDEV